MRFITIGDAHGDALSSLIPEANLRMVSVLRGILDEALKSKKLPKCVILKGDISHHAKMSGEFLNLLLQLFVDYDDRLYFYILGGNHDKHQKDVFSLTTIQPLLDSGRLNVKFVSEPYVTEWDGVPIEFLPFPYTQPTINKGIVFAHTEYEGSLADNGFELPVGKHTILKSDVKKKDNIWYIGHLHTQQSYKGKVFFAGAPYPLTTADTTDKFYYKVSVRKNSKGKRVHSNKLIPIKKTWAFVKVSVDTPEALEALLKRKRCYYKVDLGFNVTASTAHLLEPPYAEASHDKSFVIQYNVRKKVQLDAKMEEEGGADDNAESITPTKVARQLIKDSQADRKTKKLAYKKAKELLNNVQG